MSLEVELIFLVDIEGFEGKDSIPENNEALSIVDVRGRPLFLYVEGEEGSLAQNMADFIEVSNKNYPYCYGYSLIGPNSNTYVQSVLDRFPESRMQLSWNALGKNFPIH